MKLFTNLGLRVFVFSSVIVVADFLAGCAGPQTNVKVPTVSFQGINFENVDTDVAAQHVTMDVLLRFKITNPLGVPLVIPEHQVKLQLDDHDVAALMQTNAQLVVPSQGNPARFIGFISIWAGTIFSNTSDAIFRTRWWRGCVR